MKTRASWVVIISVAVAVWALVANVNHAQNTVASAGGTRIGVVDLVRVFNDFEQTKALNAELERYKRQVTEEKQRKEEDLSVEKQTLQGFSPDSEEYRQRRKALEKKVIEYQVWMRVKTESLEEQHRMWIERTYATATQCIADVAKERGIQVVLTREELDTSVEDTNVLRTQILNRKVVYYDSSLDLTSEVLTRLNDAFAKSGGAKSIRLGS